jgi:hypothetical protein
MVGNESSLSSSDFWKDGLGLGFGLVGGGGDFSTMGGGGNAAGQGGIYGGYGAGIGMGMGGVPAEGGNGQMDYNTSVFDFWDLSTPQPTTTGTSGMPAQQQGQPQQDYLLGGDGGGAGNGYEWNSVGTGGGENRRAAEVMADQLMNSGW